MPGLVRDLFCGIMEVLILWHGNYYLHLNRRQNSLKRDYGACRRSHDLQMTELGFETKSDSHTQVFFIIPHTSQTLEKCLCRTGSAMIMNL